MYLARNSIELSKYLPSMNEPLMSTPTNMTSRPGAGGVAALGGAAPQLKSEPIRMVPPSARLPGRLSGPHLGEARGLERGDQRAGILEVAHAAQRQIEQVAAGRQHGDEVERRRHHLHGRHQEAVEQPLALGGHPLEFP